MLSDVFGEVGETLRELPSEVGTEAVGQVKGTPKKKSQNDSNAQSQNRAGQQLNDVQQAANDKNFLAGLYGATDLTPEQVVQKEAQDKALKRQSYQKIQQDIQELRAKQSQEKTAYEVGQQKGEKGARTAEEEMELWEHEQKKMEEKKKNEEKIMAPGGNVARGGETGKTIG